MATQNKIVEEFIDSLSHEQLKYVLKNFLEISPNFVEYAKKLAKTDDINALYEKISADIFNIIDSHTYKKFIDWRACMDACNELENLLEFHIETILPGNPATALKILLEFYKTGIYLAENADDSCGGVAGLMSHTEHYLEILVNTIKEASDSRNKNQCYALLLKSATSKHYDGWTDEIFTLLKLSIPLSTKANTSKLYSILDDLAQKHSKYSTTYYEDNIALLRVYIIEHLEGRKAAYEKILTEHRTDSTLSLSFNWYCEENNFVEALHVTELALSDNNIYRRNKECWLNKQLRIYKSLNNEDGILKTSKELLLLGNVETYASYKKMLQKRRTWEKEKPQLLVQLAKCMHISNYLHILNQEKEYDTMLKIITNDTYYICHYAKALWMYNPKETDKIYQEFIFKQARQATNRNQYKKVCGYLKEYAKICGIENGLNLTTNLLLTFRRRPAFTEEIMTVQNRWIGFK